MKGLKTLAIFAIPGFFFIVACTNIAPVPEAKTEIATPAPSAEVLKEGKNLFDKKCAACHGSNGEGTSIAPKIASHNMAATEMQVRNPMGKMPAFPPSQISDRDLSRVASYIHSLPNPAMAMMEWERAASETMHLWMAFLDIKNNDTVFALHHLKDTLTFIKEPGYKVEVEKAISLISRGNMLDAEHEIEEIVGSESPSGITMQHFHLQFVARALEVRNLIEVKRHTQKFMVKATDEQKKIAQELLDKAEKGDFHGAGHELEELIKD